MSIHVAVHIQTPALIGKSLTSFGTEMYTALIIQSARWDSACMCSVNQCAAAGTLIDKFYLNIIFCQDTETKAFNEIL
jgi:hypothetical protein